MLMPNAKLSPQIIVLAMGIVTYFFFGPFSSRIEKEGKKRGPSRSDRRWTLHRLQAIRKLTFDPRASKQPLAGSREERERPRGFRGR